jgi:4-hydroxy-2-oxoheptanedioate aldolase
MGIFSVFTDPLAAETLAASGFDWVLVDLQHGMASDAALPGLLQAIEGAGAAPIVRVLDGDPAGIGRALDCGAWAVVIPMVESAEQARSAVAACRYAPRGGRSFGPFRGRAALDDLPRCLVMVETGSALAHVEEICSTEGILGVFVGPSDLALSIGVDVDYPVGSGAHHEAVSRVAEAAAAAGVAAAIQTSGPDEARLRIAQGYSLVGMRSDWLAMRTAVTAMRQAVQQTDPLGD